MTPRVVQQLVDEVEEEYSFNRVLPLYMFAWSLAGLGHNRTEPDFESICRRAFDEFTRAHAEVRLVEVPWPIDLALAKPLAPEANLVLDLDLDLDPDSPRSTWLQALVHPDELAS